MSKTNLIINIFRSSALVQFEANITSNSSCMKNTVLASHTYLFAPATSHSRKAVCHPMEMAGKAEVDGGFVKRRGRCQVQRSTDRL